MDGSHPDTESHGLSPLILPMRSLLVLSGPAGAGKSTFARKLVQEHAQQGFKHTMIVSSDECRAFVCDDENNQQVNRDTFDLFHYIINKRMFWNRFTIADSTALYRGARQKLLDLAKRHNYYTCLLVFNVPTAISLRRDQRRARFVGERVITYHGELVLKALQDVPNEGWDQVHILDEHAIDTVTIEMAIGNDQ
jgi:predicted kinase